MKRMIIPILSSLVLSFIITNVIAVDINDVKYHPQNPRAGETVTFYFNTTENVESAKLWIEECKGSQCFLPKTIEMIEIQPGKFSAEYELRDDVTSVHYKLNVTLSDGTTMETEMGEFEVSPKEESKGEDNKTPGYEIILAVVAVVLTVIYKRVRT